jgi:hypothetical protein
LLTFQRLLGNRRFCPKHRLNPQLVYALNHPADIMAEDLAEHLVRHLEEAVIAYPSPWPPTPGGRACVLDMLPQSSQPILSPAVPPSDA